MEEGSSSPQYSAFSINEKRCIVALVAGVRREDKSHRDYIYGCCHDRAVPSGRHRRPDRSPPGTFSIAYGVITDISSPAERGTFVSIVSFAITIAPSLGPILGGALSYAAGWPWIFWFLAIASGLCLILMIILLPETSRTVVGNGSIAPPTFSKLPIPRIFRSIPPHDVDSSKIPRLRLPNPFNSLTILLRKDNFIIITACGLLYVVYTCINASLSVILVGMYDLSEWEAGLIYIPFGMGGVFSTFFSGALLNKAYSRSRTKMGLSTDKAKGDDLDEFDVEKARLGLMWTPLIINIIGVIAFGWVLHFRQHIAIPLTIQFILGMCMQLEFSIYNTLLADKNHRHPAAAQAASNIIRCAFAAIMVSFLDRMIHTFRIGWTFSFMGGLCILVVALFAVDFHFGARWRQHLLSEASKAAQDSNNRERTKT
ncbi:hypothetical protein LMH87_006480 [Akanthomyces muscarius]|uniref:Major facilitator superfamily (MFS) profile domain-containing protein n=1 Tax=Akanthomyces muscarius TaxID=2231603 RepID=A0A9W8QQW6_AKAMU|nr:hypothetical protein LMH87_006480 [Akanthomyces muscarius]KAJ4164824.1 hypothetical protein LMH87_006480 [Akanthomyces muscarius]